MKVSPLYWSRTEPSTNPSSPWPWGPWCHTQTVTSLRDRGQRNCYSVCVFSSLSLTLVDRLVFSEEAFRTHAAVWTGDFPEAPPTPGASLVSTVSSTLLPTHTHTHNESESVLMYD